LKYTYDPPLQSGSSPFQVRRLLTKQLLDGGGSLLDQTSYVYENPYYSDFLTGVIDGRGVRYSTIAYDLNGRAISSGLAGGQNSYSVSYVPASGPPPNVLSRIVTNPLGKVTQYNFSNPGNPFDILETQVVGDQSANCPASASALAYDRAGFVNSETDEEGRVTTYVNDSRGRPLTVTRGAGTAQAMSASIVWDANWNIPDQIVEPGLTTNVTVASTGVVTQIQKIDTTTQTLPYSTKGQTRTWAFGYNSTGQLTAVTDPSGASVAYAYNATGGLKSIADQLGHVTTVTAWNARNQPTSFTDPNGVVVNLSYEPARGLLSQLVVDAAGSPSTTTIAYDQIGEVTQVTLPNGVSESYTYDGARRLTSVTNSAGETIHYTRDAMGDATAVSIANAASATTYSRARGFDELGRLIKQFAVGTELVKFGYDRTSNLTSVTDPLSNVFSYGFDPLNRLIQEVDQSGATVNLARDGQDNIVGYQDPRSNVTSYVRNGFGEIIQEISPDRGTTTYVRDARGLVTQKTDARGVVTNYTYDTAGRLTYKNYAGQSKYWQSFAWDATAPDNRGLGRLVGAYSESGVNWRAFDAQGRIWVDYRTNNPAPALATRYGYDAAGNVTEIDYPSGRRVLYARDAMGRVSAVTTYQNSAAAAQTVVWNVKWNPYGPRAGMSFGFGAIETDTLDATYRATRVQVGSSGSRGLVLDRSLSWIDDEVTGIVDNNNPGTSPPFTYSAQTQAFAYTATHRLAAATGYYGALAWTYDAVGNRLSETRNGVASSYLYPLGSNRLQSVASTANTRSFAYDAAGNMLTDSRAGALGMTFAYDVEGRLASAFQTSAPQSAASYGYDAFGRLASRAANGTTIFYIHDINDHIIAETDTTGATQREYIWLNDTPVAVVDGVSTASPRLYSVLTDHLGRPARMVAQDWSWAWDVIYEPFGAVSYIWTNPETLDIRFPGQWFQLETGLAYNWHRHYDATLGRYIQPDPLGLPALLGQAPSTHGYAGQNPLSYVDPSGLQQQKFPVPLNPNGPFLPYVYSPTLLDKLDPFHNFPLSYDPEILAFGKLTIDKIHDGTRCYRQYNIDGYLNGELWQYELGIEYPLPPNTDPITVTHRFFRPK
jgi:RHS repeat-associated protein